jgi:hypothetical protein
LVLNQETPEHYRLAHPPTTTIPRRHLGGRHFFIA